jgi:SAM-dependent methyltransferase
MKKYPVLFAIALLCLSLVGCWNSGPDPTREYTEDPNQIDSDGQPGMSDDYSNTNRMIWQKPELVLDRMGDIKNKVVADIGAGTGFFAFRLTPMAKKVIAIDINQNLINVIDSIRTVELSDADQNKLETRLADPDNAHLSDNEADVVLLVNTYLYLGDRVAYLKNLKKGIAPGGKIIIVDVKRQRLPQGEFLPPQSIRVPQHLVEEELEQAGFQLLSSDDTSLIHQYMVVAQKKL